MTLNKGQELLQLDTKAAVENIVMTMRESVVKRFKRRGVVLGLSGGIDSSTCAALAVEAFGKDRVMGLHMPEGESADDTLRLSQMLADHFGMPTALEDITEILKAAGCYTRRDDAIREVLPEYGPGWKCKIVLPSLLDGASYRIYSVVAKSPDGEIVKRRLTPSAYLGVVAASNFKQRARKMLEYYYADKLNYAVIGTPNRLEYDQGFFVKNGDGSADVKPIAHLYKTQVYEVAAALGVPAEILSRPPTTDTYSMEQGQDEFYFSLPYHSMDVCLFGKNNNMAPAEVAGLLGLKAEQVARVYEDIDGKRSTTSYMHASPVMVQSVAEVAH